MSESLAHSIPRKESCFLRVWCALKRWTKENADKIADFQFAITGCARLLEVKALARDMLPALIDQNE